MNNKTGKRPTFWFQFKAKIFKLLVRNKHNTEHLTLTHNTIYVLPSKLGVSFLVVTMLNFILGINYQNNLILAMAYLMLVVMIFSLLMGYSNLKGLKIDYKNHIASYAPCSALLELQLKTEKKCQSLQFIYENKTLTTVDEITSQKQIVNLDLGLKERGEYPLRRLKIISKYPFGLVSVWSYMQLAHTVFVYPQQLKPLHEASLQNNHNTDDGLHKNSHGSDEFDGLNIHQPGMNMKRISWKHYAKTQQLMVKEFVNYSAQSVVFDFNQLQGNTESRLQQLSYLVTQAYSQGVSYSLQLEAGLYAISDTKEHCKQCLEALSRFAKDENESH